MTMQIINHTALNKTLDAIAAMSYSPDETPALPKECYTSAEFFRFEKEEVFSRRWACVGRVEQLEGVGDHIAAEVAGEPVLVVRQKDGSISAMSAVCQHRGQVVCETSGKAATSFRCPLHFWSYDISGKLIGAAHMGDRETTDCLKNSVALHPLRCEVWHGFVFVNLDQNAGALAPTLSKLEPFWEGYKSANLRAVPPTRSDTALPWNWKIHVENFTDAYHPGFVHRGTHDIAPSVHATVGDVKFVPRDKGDNAIIRSVPLLVADAGMTSEGWGETAQFPAIKELSDAQRKRLTFVLMPPSLTLVFAPGAVAYTLLGASGVCATYASNDRVTAGGWLLPESTIGLPDFKERAKAVSDGGSKIWAQDVPVNLAMQKGKESSYQPKGIYGPLEKTLVQFNAWLHEAYMDAIKARKAAD